MAKYDANQIAALLQAGDSAPYHDSGSSAEELTGEFKTRTQSFNALLGRMESAWTGESSDSAATSLSALQEATTVSSNNLHDVSMQMNTQAESFSDVKNKVGTGPGPKPEETFAGSYFPMFTDNDEQISQWNEKSQQVIDAYDSYSNGTSENAGVFPSTYGELTGSPEGLKFSVEDSGGGGEKRVSDVNVRDSGGTGTSSSSSGGTHGSGSGVPGVGSGSGSGGGGIGTGPSGGGSGIPGVGTGGPLQPGGSTGTDRLPPGAVRLPDGSIRYADGTIRTPDGRIIPPGGTRASSRGAGAGAGRDGSSFGPGGAAAAGAAGMMGGGMIGGAAGGDDTHSGARPGSGAGAGAGAKPGMGGGMGGAKVPGGMGGGMGRGGMGMGGMMGGGAGRGGGGDDDKEHRDEYYIRQEMDPGLKTETDEFGEKLVDESTGFTVVPPVIGE